MSSHHNDARRCTARLNLLNQLHPAHSRQSKIGNHEISHGDQRKRLLGTAGLIHLEAGGLETSKIVPFPASLRTEIFPPCSSTILATSASPSPTPFGFVVKNGLNTLSRCSGSIP